MAGILPRSIQLPKGAHSLDYHAFWETVKVACRKFDITTAQCLKRYCRNSRFVVAPGCELAKISETKLKIKIRKPEEYVPGGAIYLEDFDEDSTFSFREPKQRRGYRDERWDTMLRDSMRCRRCGVTVDKSTARVDHIVSVKHFANYRQAHTPGNLQTLCINCHKEKTNEERRSQR